MGKLKMRIAFGYADKIKAQYVILIAPEEYKKGNIILKDLTPPLPPTTKWEIGALSNL